MPSMRALGWSGPLDEHVAPLTVSPDCQHRFSDEMDSLRGALQVGNRRSQFSPLRVDRRHIAIEVRAPHMRGTYCLDRGSVPWIEIRRAAFGARIDFRPHDEPTLHPIARMTNRLCFFAPGPVESVRSRLEALGWVEPNGAEPAR